MRRIAFLLLLGSCSLGCVSWRQGTVAPQELPDEFQAHAPRKLKTLQLASLGTAAHSEHQIHAGDLLEVTISDLVGQGQFYPLPVRVLEDGSVRLPLAGAVTVAGLNFPEAEQSIFAAYSSQGLLKKPLVTVALRETRKVRVFVLGAVNKPGQYELPASDSDLLSAVVAAGGLTGDADPSIEVRRRNGRRVRGDQSVVPASFTVSQPPVSQPPVTGPIYPNYHWPASARPPVANSPYHSKSYPQAGAPMANPEWNQTSTSLAGMVPALDQVIHLDLTDETAKQKLAQGFYLQNGDTITVEDRKTKPIYVMGMVNKPGEYPMPVDRDIRVLEAIGLAGGVDRASLPDKALVVRQRPDGSGIVSIRIDLDKAKKSNAENIRLMQGDTVSVEETAKSFTRGLLRSAVRVGLGANVSPTLGIP
jgi:polysaccharide biosynthesis/export protein